MSKLLEIAGLTKTFGPITAVDNISFSVDRGEVLGFLGPNGAGKSTTMKMITGFLAPNGGSVQVCGHDVAVEPLAAKQRIGYLPEGAPLYGDMTPASLLDFVAEVRRLSPDQKRTGIEYAVEKLHLENVLQQPIETLSKGYKRRVGLAQAIIHDPDVLILDEPTDGLDPNQKHEVRTLLNEMADRKAIIISTHILEEVDAICSRAIVIARGRIVADQMPAQLEARSRYHNAVGIRIASEHADACAKVLQSVSAVTTVETMTHGNGLTELLAFSSGGGNLIEPVRAAIAGGSLEVSEIFVERGRLDDVFRTLTIGEGADSAGEGGHA